MDLNERSLSMISTLVKAVAPLVGRILGMFRIAPRQLKTRTGRDRRTNQDRRGAPMSQRVRVGLWFQYHRHTRSGEFEPMPLDPHRKASLQDALWPEVRKYKFKDRHGAAEISPAHALNSAIEHVWLKKRGARGRSRDVVAVYVIDEIAEYLCTTYDVHFIDKRVKDRRESDEC